MENLRQNSSISPRQSESLFYMHDNRSEMRDHIRAIFGERLAIKPAEVASLLGMNVKKILRYTKEGSITAISAGDGHERKHWRYTSDHIISFIENREHKIRLQVMHGRRRKTT